MDDPTRRCENDTGIETRLPGLPFPSGSLSFFCLLFSHPPDSADGCRHLLRCDALLDLFGEGLNLLIGNLDLTVENN